MIRYQPKIENILNEQEKVLFGGNNFNHLINFSLLEKPSNNDYWHALFRMGDISDEFGAIISRENKQLDAILLFDVNNLGLASSFDGPETSVKIIDGHLKVSSQVL